MHSAPGATAHLTIDLGALRANWRSLAQKVGAAECAAVVKADGYGVGLEAATRALLAEGCRTFFVARLSEGVRARGVAPAAAIYVLDGLTKGTAPVLRTHNLRPVLSAMEDVREWRAAGPAALHFDTGMNRLGLSLDEAHIAQAAMGDQTHLVMSHFTSSEHADSPHNREQITRFARLSEMIQGASLSLCNSSGIFLPSRPWNHLVRPGYALYGGNPTPRRPNPMRPVVTLEATIVRVREAATGETVGYNRVWTARRPSRIAIVGLGYADGVPRGALGTDERAGAEVLVGGVRCPIVGRVSMDLIAVDATDAPIVDVARGAPVEFLGATIGVDEFGERAGTIGYEILTNLGRRASRRYVGGASA